MNDPVAEFTELMQSPEARQAFVDLKAQHAEKQTALRYQHVLQAVASRPWMITPEMLQVIVDIVTFRAYGGRLSAEEIDARVTKRREPAPPPRGMAVIPIAGPLVPKASMFTEMSGATSVDQIRGQLRTAMGDPGVGGIVLDVDSPGGMVDGIPELAAEIRQARRTKPISAFANTEAGSAAYYLASQADEVWASPSSRLGSIGVVMAHEDISGSLEQQGVRTTLITHGAHKAEGNPFQPLGDDARSHLQGMVDELGAMFEADVAKGRGVPVDRVRAEFGQGRMFLAREAVKRGLADQTGTLEDVLGDMSARINATRPAALEATGATFPSGGFVITGAEVLVEEDSGSSEPEVDPEVSRIKEEIELLSL